VGSSHPQAQQLVTDMPVWSWALLAAAAGVMLRGSR